MNDRKNLRAERGGVAPLALISVLLLFGVLACSIDQGIACAVKTKQETALAAVRSRCMEASFALPAKNAEQPGAVVAAAAASTLRDNGFEGRATIWFYELPQTDVGTARRLWIVGVQVEEGSPALFARGFGWESFPVASTRIIVIEPYADTRSWRPQDSGNGRYALSSGESIDRLSFERLDAIDQYPVEIADRAVMAAGAGFKTML